MTEPADGELERMIAELESIALSRIFALSRNDVLALIAAIRARLAEDEALRTAAGIVVKHCRESEDQGYRSRERQYVLDMLERFFLPKPPALHPKEGG